MKPFLRSVRHADFRIYLLATGSANLAVWFQRLAQDWLVLQLSNNSGTALGLTTGAQFLPLLLFAPLGGVIADTLPKRVVIQWTQLAQTINASLLLLLVLTGTAELWHAMVIAFATGAAAAIEIPARQALVAELVGQDDVANAVALDSVSYNIARIVGPAAAGILIGVSGLSVVLVLNIVANVAAIATIAAIRRQPCKRPIRFEKRALTEGLRYLRDRGDLQALLLVLFCIGCFGLNFQLTLALMTTDEFGRGAAQYGLLSSFIAVGSLIGALHAAHRNQATLQAAFCAGVAFGIAEIVSGLMPTFVAFALILPLVGYLSITFITSANATLMSSSPSEVRARVAAVYVLVFLGGSPLGSIVMGWLADAVGARWALIGGGAVSTASAGAAWLWMRHFKWHVRVHSFETAR
jgi:MFS family permease